MKALGLGVILLGVVACSGDATGPTSTEPVVEDAIRVPHTYADSVMPIWWEYMQKCSGLKGPISFWDITFYNVPHDNFRYGTPPDTGIALGLWVPARRQIYVARLDDVRGNDRVIRTLKHEMMHALLHPIHGHPPEWFESGPCGNLVKDKHDYPYGASVISRL